MIGVRTEKFLDELCCIGTDGIDKGGPTLNRLAAAVICEGVPDGDEPIRDFFIVG